MFKVILTVVAITILFFEKIRAEAQLELAKRWNGVMPVNMYSGTPFPVIDVQ